MISNIKIGDKVHNIHRIFYMDNKNYPEDKPLNLFDIQKGDIFITPSDSTLKGYIKMDGNSPLRVPFNYFTVCTDTGTAASVVQAYNFLGLIGCQNYPQKEVRFQIIHVYKHPSVSQLWYESGELMIPHNIADAYINDTSNKTMRGKVSFSKGLSTSIAPSADTDIPNKAYVDQAIAAAIVNLQG